MPKIAYRQVNIRAAGQSMIRTVNKICAEYAAAGYSLTLRQVYYQMVARDYIPNNQRSYANLGELINSARLCGLTDWYAIEDRTRYARSRPHWDSPDELLASTALGYHIDLRVGQPEYIECWVEKDALIDIVEQVANKHDVTCFSCRGYTSQTAMWNAARRLQRHSMDGEIPLRIIHVGDHDPSGIDMSRDIFDRISMFLEGGDFDGEHSYDFDVERVALNMDQIKQYNPPPNPAKTTDSRYEAYIEKYGTESWELDALEPKLLSGIIEEAILKHTDEVAFADMLRKQEEERAVLGEAADFAKNRDKWSRAFSLPYYFLEETCKG